ncbi:MerR family transcriptional regulator [Streptomyces sp. WAC 01325]|uniref:MerR family transcriptional regulator n=1 Tax=Streptomyces TaxID=1883 RepID=UPI000F87CEC5|nr:MULTISPECIES: MerR family transcriptional regulator [Streptomyces]RSN17803.1 MerR family transcriptional regulator [Streptomyces sp. WAC 01325]
MKIGELAAKTGVAPRLLRYYEEVGILTPWRAPNGYRSYGEPAVDRVLQIRELLEAGLTTDMIREVLPCLDAQKDERENLTCPDIDVAELDGLRRHLAAIKRRIDVLQRNERAIEAYLKVRAENTSVPPAAAGEVVALVGRP